MALRAVTDLPAFDAMASEGVEVVAADAAPTGQQLAVGLLNLMPDAALRATDRQFLRLVSAGANELDVAVHPFTVGEEARGPEAREHIRRFYQDFEDLKATGLDALIVTGANPAQHLLEEEPFWEGLGDVLDWAVEETGGILCSCLATHAVVQKYRGLRRTRLPQKRWGVYSHKRIDDHPLLDGLSEEVEAPHSHWFDMTREEMESVGLVVLLESEEAGVHMAVDEDDFYVFFQGHPEYDTVSLLKEYRRELARFWRGEIDEYPPVPEHYFTPEALDLLAEYRPKLEEAKAHQTEPERLSEDALIPTGRHTWNDEGKVVVRNWLRRLAGA